jgi:hypothetical protein
MSLKATTALTHMQQVLLLLQVKEQLALTCTLCNDAWQSAMFDTLPDVLSYLSNLNSLSVLYSGI